MKTFNHILRYILVAAALASCQRTDDSVAEPVVSESFTATIESFEDQTRTALDGKYAVWTSGDEIAVFQGRSTADRYVLYDLKASSFRLAERAEDEGDAIEANVALYPYSESLTCEKTDAGYKIDNISFPSVQQYKENSFSEESFFMAALTAGLEDRVLDFRNICGGLRLYITGEKNVKINKIVLSGNDDERLAGVGSVTCDSEGNVSFNGFTGSASERQISLNCGGIRLDEQDASQFIISLPPVIFSKGFTVTLNAKVDGADVTYIRSTDKPHTIRKSTFLSMPSFVFGEVPPEPVLNVSPSSLTFAAEGGEQKVTLSSNQDWDVVCDSPWLSVTPSSGTASEHTATITLKAPANENEDVRTATVTFTAGDLIKTVTVTQSGKVIPPSLEVIKTYFEVSAEGASLPLEVTSNVNWTASTDSDWVSISPSFGVASDKAVSVILTVNANDTLNERTATVTFTAGDLIKTVTVTQSGKVLPPSLEISSAFATVGADGGTLSLRVQANYDWSVIVDDSWLSVSPSYGIGSSESVTVIVSVISNESEFSRAGQVVFASRGLSRTLTVEQEGFVPPSKEGDYIDEYGINHGQGVKIGETVWAPVNCGYHKDNFKYGKLYQWGRKYGQGYDGALYDVDSNYIGDYSDSSVPETVSGPVSLSTGQSKANEDKFYYNSSSPWDWCSPQDHELWNSGSESAPVKTEYDPCPEGWRVPTYAELDELANNYSSFTTADNGQMGRWFSGPNSYTASVPQVFFPAAAYRNGGGGAGRRGSYGYYWSSSTNNPYAHYLCFGSSDVLMNGNHRAGGYSVRCVQE